VKSSVLVKETQGLCYRYLYLHSRYTALKHFRIKLYEWDIAGLVYLKCE